MTTAPPEYVRTLGNERAHTRIVLVRHGEPAAAPAGIVAGPTGDTGLTELGRAQAAALAARLAATGELADAAALYASTLPRALETAAILAGAFDGLEVQVRHDLREHDPGELDGRTWTEVIVRGGLPDFDSDPDAPLAAGAESLRGFHTRARGALDALSTSHRGATVVVACHGGIVAAAVALCFELPVERRVLLPTRYASMTIVEVTARGWRLARYNDTYGQPVS